jgi:iron(III) transport system ATP-binding protein
MVGVTFSGVTKHYGETVAISDVSFEVGKGELFFLLGPSGCGKTTILRMLAGFLRPDEGDILFDGRSVVDVPPHKRNTGMVFQSYALWPHMSVEQNVAYGLEERRLGRAEIERRLGAALETVLMSRYRDRMPNQLSGGQQQRIALARALVIEPDVVLLDEPLSNLDARLRLEMRREISRIHAQTGITMLYVTHDQKEALSMAQRMAVMSMGRIEQVGTPRGIYRRPSNRFVAEFIGEANLIGGTLKSVEGRVGAVATDLGELRAALGAEPPEVGAPVDCLVRPECLHLGAGRENSFPAELVRSTYLGEVEQHVLRTGGLELLALQSNPGGAPPEAGSTVQAGFDADDAVVLPRGNGS